ncbi:MAG TPA: hypothetical protein PLK80_12670 [bacterium]|nr:MAG: hypothetical protein BWY28_00682 [bacterium ADurb.Bin236]HOY63504.1 hypothetical protein [bacterium]HPI77579.1 hypothetical protein [bacterium]HPN94820.1 hypothetical protein [bacterium]
MTENEKPFNRSAKTANRAALGGYVGIVVGSMGWLIGFAVVCLTSGNGAALARFAAPATAVSLGVAFLVIICCDYAVKLRGYGGMFQLALYGGMAWGMGLLLLLINYWIAPLIDSSPAMAKTMRDMNAVYRVDDLWAILMLSAGAIMLGIFAFMAVRVSGAKVKPGE